MPIRPDDFDFEPLVSLAGETHAREETHGGPPEVHWNKRGLSLAFLLAVLIMAILFYGRRTYVSIAAPNRNVPRSSEPSTPASTPPPIASDAATLQAVKPLPHKSKARDMETGGQNSTVSSIREPPGALHAIPSAPSNPALTPTDSAHPPATPSASDESSKTQTSTKAPAVEKPPQSTLPQTYQGPLSGDFVWSGTVEKGQIIEITNGTPNIGTISGHYFPGVPVSISIAHAQVAVVTQPNPLNHFSVVAFRSTSKGHIEFGVHWTLLGGN